MAEELTVMQKLEAQTQRLKQRVVAGPGPAAGDETLTLESLLVVSEALQRMSRDIRQIRLQSADRI